MIKRCSNRRSITATVGLCSESVLRRDAIAWKPSETSTVHNDWNNREWTAHCDSFVLVEECRSSLWSTTYSKGFLPILPKFAGVVMSGPYLCFPNVGTLVDVIHEVTLHNV